MRLLPILTRYNATTWQITVTNAYAHTDVYHTSLAVCMWGLVKTPTRQRQFVRLDRKLMHPIRKNSHVEPLPFVPTT